MAHTELGSDSWRNLLQDTDCCSSIADFLTGDDLSAVICTSRQTQQAFSGPSVKDRLLAQGGEGVGATRRTEVPGALYRQPLPTSATQHSHYPFIHCIRSGLGTWKAVWALGGSAYAICCLACTTALGWMFPDAVGFHVDTVASIFPTAVAVVLRMLLIATGLWAVVLFAVPGAPVAELGTVLAPPIMRFMGANRALTCITLISSVFVVEALSPTLVRSILGLVLGPFASLFVCFSLPVALCGALMLLLVRLNRDAYMRQLRQYLGPLAPRLTTSPIVPWLLGGLAIAGGANHLGVVHLTDGRLLRGMLLPGIYTLNTIIGLIAIPLALFMVVNSILVITVRLSAWIRIQRARWLGVRRDLALLLHAQMGVAVAVMTAYLAFPPLAWAASYTRISWLSVDASGFLARWGGAPLWYLVTGTALVSAPLTLTAPWYRCRASSGAAPRFATVLMHPVTWIAVLIFQWTCSGQPAFVDHEKLSLVSRIAYAICCLAALGAAHARTFRLRAPPKVLVENVVFLLIQLLWMLFGSLDWVGWGLCVALQVAQVCWTSLGLDAQDAPARPHIRVLTSVTRVLVRVFVGNLSIPIATAILVFPVTFGALLQHSMRIGNLIVKALTPPGAGPEDVVLVACVVVLGCGIYAACAKPERIELQTPMGRMHKPAFVLLLARLGVHCAFDVLEALAIGPHQSEGVAVSLTWGGVLDVALSIVRSILYLGMSWMVFAALGVAGTELLKGRPQPRRGLLLLLLVYPAMLCVNMLCYATNMVDGAAWVLKLSTA